MMIQMLRPPTRGLLTAAALTMSSLSHPALSQPSPQLKNEAMGLMSICRADYERLCSGVQPGGGRILACLKRRQDELSVPCAAAMPRAQALKSAAERQGVFPK